MMLQIWHFGFSHFLFSLDVTMFGNLYFMRLLVEIGGCLYAQIGVASNGCLDDVNLL